MLGDGDIVSITDVQTLSAQDIVNVFFYVIDILIVGITLVDLLAEFEDKVLTPILGIQTGGVHHAKLVGRNLTNAIDIVEYQTDLNGNDTIGGNSMPAYVAAGCQLHVSSRTTRPGSKRFAGVGEDRVTGEIYTPRDPQGDAVLIGLISDLEVTHVTVGSGTATPIIVGRDVLGDLDLERTQVVAGASFYPTIRSQVSRRAPT